MNWLQTNWPLLILFFACVALVHWVVEIIRREIRRHQKIRLKVRGLDMREIKQELDKRPRFLRDAPFHRPNARTLHELISEVERDHFRTDSDSGSVPHAMMLWNNVRVFAGLPALSPEDLPKWDEVAGSYVPRPGSPLGKHQRPQNGESWLFMSTTDGLKIHNGPVVIFRRLGPTECDLEVGPMWECISPMGKFHAFHEELTLIARPSHNPGDDAIVSSSSP